MDKPEATLPECPLGENSCEWLDEVQLLRDCPGVEDMMLLVLLSSAVLWAAELYKWVSAKKQNDPLPADA